MAYIFGSIWDRFNRNALNDLSKNVEIQGKSIQNLVAEGQLTPSQYAQLISIVNGNVAKGEISVYDINKNKGKFDQTYMTDEFLKQMSGNAPINSTPADGGVTRRKLAKESVAPYNTDFARSPSLFKGISENMSVSGGINSGVFMYGEGKISYITEIQPGKTYSILKTDSNRFRVATSDVYPQDGQAIPRYLTISDTESQFSFTSQAGDNYLIVDVTVDGEPPERFQVLEGRNIKEFTEKVYIDLSDDAIPEMTTDRLLDNSVSPEKTTFAKTENLFKGKTESLVLPFGINNDYVLTNPTGEPVSYVIEIEPDKYYSILKTESNRFRAATLSVYPAIGEQVSRHLFSEDDSLNYSFKSADGENYLFVAVAVDGPPPEKFQVLEGEGRKEFSDSVKINLSEDSLPKISLESKAFIADTPSGNYVSNAETYYSIGDRDINILYGLYDDLMAKNPDYITRTLLSNDESGLPIYRYDFSPPEMAGYSHPKIVYSHPHGHETGAAYGGFSFFNEMCGKWQTDDLLRMLRWNVHFVVIPTLNPWGFTNRERKNFNGVDLNRNFPTGFSVNPDPQSYNYGGESPLSEIGSQVMYDIMKNENGVVLALDHHNHGPDAADVYPIWIATNDYSERQTIFSITNYLSYHIKQHYTTSIDTNISNYEFRDTVASGLAGEWVSQGVTGLLLENTYTLENSEVEGQRLTLDILGNAFIGFIRKMTS